MTMHSTPKPITGKHVLVADVERHVDREIPLGQGIDDLEEASEFLEPVDGGMLSARRRDGAPGLAGGGRGDPGRNLLRNADRAAQRVEHVGADGYHALEKGVGVIFDISQREKRYCVPR